jgi:hypothetical protein
VREDGGHGVAGDWAAGRRRIDHARARHPDLAGEGLPRATGLRHAGRGSNRTGDHMNS